MGSCVGHFRSNHLIGAIDLLVDNQKKLSRLYNINIPRRITNNEDIYSLLKPPFSNATFYDIAISLHMSGFTENTPEDLLQTTQGMQDEFEHWIIERLQGKKKNRLLDRKGNPLFGIIPFSDINLDDFEGDDDADLAGLVWGLYVMDSDFYRPLVGDAIGINIGFGKTVPINISNLMASTNEDEFHDLYSLSQLETASILNLPENTPLTVLREKFYEKIMPRLVELGIVVNKDVQQSKDITSGYVRIHGYLGTGTSDISAFGAAWLMKGPKSALLLELADAQDTLQVLTKNLKYGGQDESLIERLRKKFPNFDSIVKKYTQPEFTEPLIHFAYEDPTLPFFLPSCSQSYQWRDTRCYDREDGTSLIDKLPTTIQREMWFFENFAPQYNLSSVSRYMPQWPVGFERGNSRRIMDHYLKLTREFIKEQKFPKGSWVYDNIHN